MSRIAYVNGRYVPQHLATVNIEDRGYQFADGVYEVIGVYGGKLVDAERHFDRLERSLAELRIAAPCRRGVLGLIGARLRSDPSSNRFGPPSSGSGQPDTFS